LLVVFVVVLMREAPLSVPDLQSPISVTVQVWLIVIL
jgi:hypothetical protein